MSLYRLFTFEKWFGKMGGRRWVAPLCNPMNDRLVSDGATDSGNQLSQSQHRHCASFFQALIAPANTSSAGRMGEKGGSG